MQITVAPLIAILPLLTAAAPVAEPAASTAASPNYFGGLTSRSGSNIHLLPINANGGHFFLNKPTSSYCPSETVGCQACPPGNTTVFAGGKNTLSLGTVVPGGQQVYVAKDGALSFTQAHSADVPKGSVVDGFSFKTGKEFGTLSWGTGFVACPVKGSKTEFQIYGTSKTIKAGKDCEGFEFLTPSVKAPGAWQYA